MSGPFVATECGVEGCESPRAPHIHGPQSNPEINQTAFHKVEFDLLGFGHTSIDGVTLRGVKGIHVESSVDKPTEVTIRLLASAVRGTALVEEVASE